MSEKAIPRPIQIVLAHADCDVTLSWDGEQNKKKYVVICWALCDDGNVHPLVNVPGEAHLSILIQKATE
jgi:hypothetical protein